MKDFVRKTIKINHMRDFVGKTVVKIDYIDPWDKGLQVIFSDGTWFNVREKSQSGELEVVVNGSFIKSEEEIT